MTWANAMELARAAYGACLLGLAVILLRYGRPMVRAAVDLTQAFTRASDALRSIASDAGASREAVLRVEAATQRMEQKLDLLLQRPAQPPDSKRPR